MTCLVLKNQAALIASYTSGVIHVIDLNTDAVLQMLEGHQMYIHQMIYSDLSSTLVSASEDSSAKLWNVLTGQCVATFSGHEGIISKLSWLESGKYLATSDQSGMIRIWNIEDR